MSRLSRINQIDRVKLKFVGNWEVINDRVDSQHLYHPQHPSLLGVSYYEIRYDVQSNLRRFARYSTNNA
jgi:hypothetical protein